MVERKRGTHAFIPEDEIPGHLQRVRRVDIGPCVFELWIIDACHTVFVEIIPGATCKEMEEKMEECGNRKMAVAINGDSAYPVEMIKEILCVVAASAIRFAVRR